MSLSSPGYFLVLLLGAILYHWTPLRLRWALLLGGSALFLVTWHHDRPWLLLPLLLSTVTAYFGAILLEKIQGELLRKAVLLSCIAVVLSPLIAFKWLKTAQTSLIVPIGISFYSLQIIGYLLDVARRQIRPEKHFGYFALFACFFPHLVAGPIERAQRLIPQFRSEIRFDYARIKNGMLLIVAGLFKKLVIADNLALAINPVFASPREFGGAVLLLATIFARYQIFCDFSGYTDIARGSAQVLGFELMENFKQPFFSRSIAEHWRRWHISLSTWMRDYLYLPLIASPFSRLGLYFNLVLTFVILGLWHGFTGNFLIYGLIQGALIALFDATTDFRENIATKLGCDRLPRARAAMQIAITFLFFVCLPTVFFKANDVQDSRYVLGHLFSNFSRAFSRWSSLLDFQIVSAIALVFGMEFLHFLQLKRPIRERLAEQRHFVRWGIYAAGLVGFIVLARYTAEPGHFFYQRF